MLVACQQAELDLTLEVGLDISAQARHGAVGNTERLGQGIVHFRQVGGFNLFNGDQEVSGLACHILAVVFLGESQRESLALARLHAAHGIFKFLEHLAFAHQELEVLGLAALKGLAVELAFKVHGDAVAILRCGVHGALCEAAALLAQDVNGLVDGAIVHSGRQFFDFGAGQVPNFDFRKHLEHRVKGDLALGRTVFFSNARLTGHAQTGFVGRLGKSLADLVVEHFVLHRVAIALRNHIHGHLAGTEAVHLDGAGQALEARFHLALDGGQGQAQRDLAFELFKGFNGNSHGYS